MLCDECHLRPVAVKFQISSSGQTLERALCQPCGHKYSSILSAPLSVAPPPPFALLSGMLSPAHAGASGGLVEAVRCPHCGYPFHQFQHSSMLGCARCYEAFAPQLELLLQRAQGGPWQHSGKAPLRQGGRMARRRALERLAEALAEAVREQRFEDAARLRDQIRARERELE